MGKMKEKFLNDQEKAAQDAIDAFLDEDYHLEKYYNSLKPEDSCDCNNDCPCEGEPVAMEELVKNHNDWWDSLSEEEKQKLYEEKSGADDEYINYWLKKDNESK